MPSLCYVCERKAILPTGYSQSKVLLIGDAPGIHEIDNNKPVVVITRKQTAGNVLRQELALVGADLYQFRMTNLWYHKPLDKKHKNFDNCFKASLDACLMEAKGKQAILLMGAETVQYFTGYKVSNVSGLQVESNMLSAPIIYAMVSPTIVYSGKGLGEPRFAITNFFTHIQKEGIR